ncbi:MAG: site-2 protease family protein [Acidobacteriota bacterium]
MGYDIDLGLILIQVAVLFLSLSVHESCHAWVADRLGDSTARSLGRVSFNPLVHLDPVGSLLFPLVGLLAGGLIFGWAKPVPVNVRNLRHPKQDHLLIAAAGPLSNLLLAAVCLVGLKMVVGSWTPQTAVGTALLNPLYRLLHFGLLLNVILAVFNLLPIPPLDGSWILAGILPEPLSVFFNRLRPYSLVLLILLLYSGVFHIILSPILAFVQGLAL